MSTIYNLDAVSTSESIISIFILLSPASYELVILILKQSITSSLTLS